MRYRLVSIHIEGQNPFFQIEGKRRGWRALFSDWSVCNAPPGYDFGFEDFNEAMDAYDQLTRMENAICKVIKTQP